MTTLVSSSYGFQHNGPDGIYIFYVAVDLVGQYSVRDIRTPQGLLRDSRPLPESVVRAMSDALDVVQSGAYITGSTGLTGGVTGTTGFFVI